MKHLFFKSKMEYMSLVPRLIKKGLIGYMAALGLFVLSHGAQADVRVLHTYGISLGQEVDNLIPVSASKLLPLLPAGYEIVPASSFGIGREDQGIVVIVNFRGLDPTVDAMKPSKNNRVAIDVTILVKEPSEAVEAGVNIPGAFHFYTLAMYSDDAPYAASLLEADMPIKFNNKISYQREMNDLTGEGQLIVNVSLKNSAFKSITSSLGYASVDGALNAIFWHDGKRGKTALHFHVPVFHQGDAIAQFFMQPSSMWESLFNVNSGDPELCDPDPETGYSCVVTPSLNFRFDEGDVGQLLLIK
jgi:hypothetical protein